MKDLKRLNSFISNNKWIFAKTYKNLPHEYICKVNLPIEQQEEFDYFTECINQYGIEKKFFTLRYKYLEIDDLEYWSAESSNTKIINRAKINNNAFYRR